MSSRWSKAHTNAWSGTKDDALALYSTAVAPNADSLGRCTALPKPSYVGTSLTEDAQHCCPPAETQDPAAHQGDQEEITSGSSARPWTLLSA